MRHQVGDASRVRAALCVGVTCLVLPVAAVLFAFFIVGAFATHNLKGQTIVRSLVIVCFDDADAAVQLQHREGHFGHPRDALLANRGQ